MCTYTDARWEDLRQAIQSLRGQTVVPAEVLVVVDHNQPLAHRALRELDGILVVENSERRGLSGARNTAVKAARGEVVAFLDDDAVATPQWIERLTAPYADCRVLGVGGMVEPLWPNGRPRAFPPEFDWVVGCSYRGLPEVAGPVRNLIGANMSFRRAVFERVGLFTSGIGRIGSRPMGCEETEFCIRAQRRWPGGLFVYEPAARVLHRVTPERVKWRYFRARCFAEGLSKAAVCRAAGSDTGLSSERAYALRVLPAGLARDLATALRDRDVAGLERALAITAGFGLTAAGFATGTASSRLAPRRRYRRTQPRGGANP